MSAAALGTLDRGSVGVRDEGFWQLMSEDVFFSLFLICGVHSKSQLRAALIQGAEGYFGRVTKRVNTQGMSLADAMGREASLLSEGLRDKVEARIRATSVTSQVQWEESSFYAPAKISGGGRSPGKQPSNQPSKKSDSGTDASGQWLMSNGVTVRKLPATADFPGEIRRFDAGSDYGFKVRKTGQECVYTATKTQCSECGHRPRCFRDQCNRCKMWGHSESFCRQLKK